MINTRYQIIERIIRNVYGEQPTDDSNITVNLVNKWLEDGIATAVKLNYKDAIQVDGIGYVNNSFYLTFKGITFSQDDQFTYVATLPQIPLGIGKNEGISSLRFRDASGKISIDAIPLSENQWTYVKQMPPIKNSILYKPEGSFVYALSELILSIGFTANVTMISSGDDTNLNSVLNVPQDYISIIIDYCSERLSKSRQEPKDLADDGADN